jgi:two-component system CheB/CheR fusion protein
MARLMDDLLDISRIRQGKLDLRSDLMDLRQAVEESLETVGGQIEERGCRLEVELTDQPVPMVGDPHRLRQLIVNLLTNAVRHTAAGRRILVQLSRAGERARITIQDEGVGIAPELRDRIFEPFTVQGASTRRKGGLGIGLWLVRSIAEAHDGTVSLRSEGIGRGAEFTVELPLANAILPPRRASTSPGSVGGRIVLVEDQPDLLELLEAILAGAGMNVRSAPTAEAALELFDAETPDLALVDVGLPGMSGLELSRKLRARFGSDRLRLIAVTGYGQQADREAVYEAGFDQHLIKPVDLDSLIDVIRGELAILREQPS